MDPQNKEQNEAWMRKRLQHLRKQLDEISGGMALFGCANADDLPLEVEISFLEHVLSFELAEDTTWKEQLEDIGYSMPTPDSLTEAAVETEVWEVIQRLSEMRCYLSFTNHLSDRELYQKLYTILDEPTEDVRKMEGTMQCHLDILLPGEEEDDLIWLQYYADEKTRQLWHEEFNFQLPPQSKAPYDRDHVLPQPLWPGPCAGRE